MRRRTICLVLIVAIILAVPAYANLRLVTVNPDVTFDNYEATCTVDILAEGLTDSISATMALWRGTTKIDEWSDTGTFYLSMEGTASVERYKTYRLVVNYSINGVSKPTVTIYRTYN